MFEAALIFTNAAVGAAMVLTLMAMLAELWSYMSDATIITLDCQAKSDNVLQKIYHGNEADESDGPELKRAA
jgi:hypothetical protein